MTHTVEYRRKYYQKNREKILEYYRQYRRSNLKKPKKVEEWLREWIFNTYLRIYVWWLETRYKMKKMSDFFTKK